MKHTDFRWTDTLESHHDHVCVTHGLFLSMSGCRQGVCQDYTHQGEIAKLLYFESNKGAKDELCSLDEYVSR